MRPLLGRHWLSATAQIDNCQPPMAECYAVAGRGGRMKSTFAIWPAVLDLAQHFIEHRFIVAAWRTAEPTGYATHCSPLTSTFSVRRGGLWVAKEQKFPRAPGNSSGII